MYTSITESVESRCICGHTKLYYRLLGDITALPPGWTWRRIESEHVQRGYVYIISHCEACSTKAEKLGTSKEVITR